MRSARFGLLCLLLFIVPLRSQQTQTTTTALPDQTPTAAPSAPKDAQAVTVLNQALVVAGGMSAIAAIADYTASGTVTYHLAQDVQGTVTIRGGGLFRLRIDANLPAGIHSESMTGPGTAIADHGFVRQLHSQPPMDPGRYLLPSLELGAVLNDPEYSLLYKGIVSVDGHSVHDVQLEYVLPPIVVDSTRLFHEYHTIDAFIDAATFQVVMMQDVVPEHAIRRMRYSDYRTVGGVQVPYSISEDVRNPTWLIQLDKINFNSGLQDSDFQL
jgi:hypothetical protein